MRNWQNMKKIVELYQRFNLPSLQYWVLQLQDVTTGGGGGGRLAGTAIYRIGVIPYNFI